jgi:hypothetical protein
MSGSLLRRSPYGGDIVQGKTLVIPDGVQLKQKATRTGSQGSPVWAHAPTLGDVPGEVYSGRFVVELVGDQEQVATIGAQTRLWTQAVAALREATPPLPRETALWPSEPIMARRLSSQAYFGRIVVELWTRTTNVAASPTPLSPAELIRRATRGLERLQ